MTIFIIAVLLLILLILCIKVTVEIYIKTDNFKTEKNIKIKIFGLFEIKLPKLKKKQKAEVTAKQKKKMTFADLKEKSDKITEIAKKALDAAEKIIVIEKIDTKITLALEDPMANGLAFAAVSTVVGNVFAILSQRFKTKTLSPDIKTDFESEDGVKTETKIILSARLIRLITN